MMSETAYYFSTGPETFSYLSLSGPHLDDFAIGYGSTICYVTKKFGKNGPWRPWKIFSKMRVSEMFSKVQTFLGSIKGGLNSFSVQKALIPRPSPLSWNFVSPAQPNTRPATSAALKSGLNFGKNRHVGPAVFSLCATHTPNLHQNCMKSLHCHWF